MKGPGAYAGAALLLAVLAGIAGSVLLGPEGARGVWVGAAIAALTQSALFLLLHRGLGDPKRLLLHRVGASFGRLVVIGTAAGVVATGRYGLPPAPTLLTLAGLTAGLLFLEPVFLAEARGRITNRAAER